MVRFQNIKKKQTRVFFFTFLFSLIGILVCYQHLVLFHRLFLSINVVLFLYLVEFVFETISPMKKKGFERSNEKKNCVDLYITVFAKIEPKFVHWERIDKYTYTMAPYLVCISRWWNSCDLQTGENIPKQKIYTFAWTECIEYIFI